MSDAYLKDPGFGILDPLVRAALKLLLKPLRKADYAAAQKPTKFITISDYSAAMIKKYYHRDSVIVAPPVETKLFAAKIRSFSTKPANFSTTFPPKSPNNPPKSNSFPQDFHREERLFHKLSTINPEFSTGSPQYFVISCRQATWKRVDLAIEACKKAKLPLLVIGDGSEHENLVRLAADSPYIEFLPWIGTRELAAYLQNARAYIFPSLEPFGIAAVEALAAGCPVIAYAKGGSRDIVEPGKNGLLFSDQTVSSLLATLKKFLKYRFDPVVVQKSAEKFDSKIFRQKIRHLVSLEMTNRSLPNEKRL